MFNIRFFSLLFLIISAIFPSYADEEQSPDELRKKAVALIDSYNPSSYSSLNRAEPIRQFREAADIYEKLLRTTDDNKSAEDLDALLSSVDKAYQYMNHQERNEALPSKNYPNNILEEVYPAHKDNLRYLVHLWNHGISRAANNINFPAYFGKKVTIPKEYADNWQINYILHKYILLEQADHIVRASSHNVPADEYGDFLFQFAKMIFNPHNRVGENGDGYAGLHHLTHFRDLISAFEENRLYPIKWEAKLLNPDGSPLVYQAPASWSASRSDGERVEYLYRQAIKHKPNIEFDIRSFRNKSIQLAFTPLLSYSFEARGGRVPMPKETCEELYHALPTLALTQTLVYENKKLHRINLPEELNYIKEWRSLILGGESPYSGARQNATPGDMGFGCVRNAFSALSNELVYRMQYNPAAELCKEVKPIIDTQSWRKEDKKSIHAEVDFLLAQIEGNKGAFYFESNKEKFTTYTSGRDIPLPLLYRNAPSARINIYPVKTDYLISQAKNKINTAKRLRDLLSDSRKTTENKLLLEYYRMHTVLNRDKQVWEALQAPVSKSYTLTPQANHLDTYDYLRLPELKSGIYLVQAEFNNDQAPAYTFIEISSINVYGLQSVNGYHFYAVNKETGEPIPDVSLTIDQFVTWHKGSYINDYSSLEGNTTHKTISLKTDSKGMALIPLKEKSDTLNPYYSFLVTAKKGDEKFYTSLTTSPITKEKKTHQGAYFVTDRPSYRPGQTVHWSAWMGETTLEGKASPLAGIPVTIEFGNLTDPLEITSDAKGMVSGAFTIPQNAKLESVMLRIKKAPENLSGLTNQSCYIAIEEYKKPDIILTLKTDKKRYSFGEKAKATIKASYYSGEPVSKGNVKLEIKSGYSYYLRSTSPGKKNDLPENLKTLALDSKGEATWEFDLIDCPEEWKSSDNNYYYLNYTIEATATDDSERQVTASSAFYIDLEPATFFVNIEKSYGKAGIPMSAALSFKSKNNDPLDATATATLYSITESDKDGRKLTTWDIPITKGEAKTEFIPPHGGQFKLETKVPHPSIKEKFITHSSFVYAIPGKDGALVPFTHSDVPRLLTNKSTPCIAGDKVSFLIVSSSKTKSVYVGAALGMDDEKISQFDTPSLLTEIEWTIGENSILNIPFYIWSNKIDYSFSSFSLNIKSVFPSLKLSPSISTESGSPVEKASEGEKLPQFKPKENAQVKVKVTHADGSPATNTPVVITVYDKALEEFASPQILSRFIYETTWSPFFTYHRSTRPNPDYYSNDDLFSRNNYGPDLRYNYIPEKTDDYDNFMSLLAGRYAAYAFTALSDKDTPFVDRNKALSPDSPPLSKENRNLFIFKEQSAFSNITHNASYLSNIDGLITSGARFSGSGILSSDIGLSGTGFIGGVAKGSIDSSSPMSSMVPVEVSGKPELLVKRKSVMQEQQDPMLNDEGRESSSIMRSEFADLLKWSGTLMSDENGMVSLPVTMPDNLTTWKARAWAVDEKLGIGFASVEFVTSQPFIVQLHTPRFLVEKDESQFTTVLRNNTDKEEEVSVSLRIESGAISLKEGETAEKKILVPAQGSASISWMTIAIQEGESQLTVKAQGVTLGDAMTMPLPIIVRGTDRGEHLNLSLRPNEESAKGTLSLPEYIRPEMTRLNINIAPGLAPVIARSLPFLMKYPYGCAEQRLNKFTPALVAYKTLRNMNLDLTQLSQNLPFPEKDKNPLATNEKFKEFIQDELSKLLANQNPDGGWSWFPGGTSDTYITALVVHGLNCIEDKDEIKLPPLYSLKNAHTRAYDYLLSGEARRLKSIVDNNSRSSSQDVFTHLVLHESGNKKFLNQKMRDRLIKDRRDFSPYALARLALILRQSGEKQISEEIITAIKKVISTDENGDTSWLNLSSNRSWWSWDQDDIESHAAVLRLLTETEPDSNLTRQFAKWLADNRSNSFYWKSTRDTAYAIEALCKYIQASGQGTKPMTVELTRNGIPVHRVKYDPAKLAEFKSDLTIPGELPSGEHTWELRRVDGDKATPVYLALELRYFSIAPKLEASGTDLKVNRKVYLFSSMTSASPRHDSKQRPPLADLDTLHSGDIIEVVLEIEAANDYQYLMLRDPKAAGCEPFNLQSGYQNASSEKDSPLWCFREGYYTELADLETRIFIPRLQKGKSAVSYKLRVERPGIYTALPTQIEAMYTPVLHGNSREDILTIKPREN